MNNIVCDNSAECCRELTRVWDALDIHDFNGKSASDNVRILKQQLAEETAAHKFAHMQWLYMRDKLQFYLKL